MGYEEVISLNDDLFDESKLTELALKRAISIQRLVDDFIRFYEEKHHVLVEPIEDIAINLSYSYLFLVHKKIKPLVVDRINCFKMASLMELLIVKEQVLSHPECKKNDPVNRELNALFAMTAAFSLLNCMISSSDREFYFDTINNYIDLEVTRILNEQKCWLETKELNEMPVIINSQFFNLIQILHNAPYQINGF